MDGGIEAWKRAGLPIFTDRKETLEVQRQVQIGAGSMVVLGAALGLLVSPWFFALAVFVGAA